MRNENRCRNAIAAFALALGLAACTTSAEKEMDAKVRAETPPEGPDAIAARGAQAFLNSTSLTDSQKQKLLSIHTQVYTEAEAIRKEIGQAKSLIFKTVAASNYKKEDVAILKKKIIALDQKRLEVMFKALEDVESVIGHGPGTENIYRRLEGLEGIRFGELRIPN